MGILFKKKQKTPNTIRFCNYDTSEIDVYISLARSLLRVPLTQISFLGYVYTKDGMAIAANEEHLTTLAETTAFLPGFYNSDQDAAYVALFHPTERRALVQEEVLFSVLRMLRRAWQAHTNSKHETESERMLDAEAFALAFMANKTAYDMILFERQVETRDEESLFQQARHLSYLYF